jgi:putative transposon-encoded protein
MEFTQKITDEGGNLVLLEMIRIVKKLGNSGRVSVPKELIGKYVHITYQGDKKE